MKTDQWIKWIGSAVAAVLIVIFLLWDPLGWFQKKLTNHPSPKSPTTVIVGLPVNGDSLVRMYESGARLKADNDHLTKLLACERKNKDLSKENKRLSQENSKLKSNDKKFRREIDALKKKLLKKSQTTLSSNNQPGTGTKVSSSYTAPNSAPVTNTYSPEAPGAQEFCINIRTSLSGARDGSSYWPHLEADPPTSVVAEAIPNGDHTGWNIKLPPVDAISGLYGWSNKLHVIFVRADLIDKFSPTNVSMAGGMNGWGKNNVWPFAQKENVNGTEYYVAHTK